MVEGANGDDTIVFIDGSAFNLSANARMVLNELVYDPNGTANSSLVNLVQGTISFVAGQVAKTGDMKVGTPVATMGIRGTIVIVEMAAANGPTKAVAVESAWCSPCDAQARRDILWPLKKCEPAPIWSTSRPTS